MTQEKNLLLRNLKKTPLKTQRRPEGPKENPINKKPKEEDTITLAPIDNSINEDPQELQDPQ